MIRIRIATRVRGEVRRARRGATLVLVLWLVVVLGAIAASVTASTRMTTGIASNTRARLVARYAAESGVEATVAAIEDSLVAMDTVARAVFLNALETGVVPDTTRLGDGMFVVAVLDVSARLDVNSATEEQLARFFSRFTTFSSASAFARAIRWRIERGDQGRLPVDDASPRAVRPLRSLEELRALGLVSDRVLQQAAPFLTVDGDGTINLATAQSAVLSVAGGETRTEPSRLLIVSRGWRSGHPLTGEIQAVYAITGNRLVLTHWRERLL